MHVTVCGLKGVVRGPISGMRSPGSDGWRALHHLELERDFLQLRRYGLHIKTFWVNLSVIFFMIKIMCNESMPCNSLSAHLDKYIFLIHIYCLIYLICMMLKRKQDTNRQDYLNMLRNLCAKYVSLCVFFFKLIKYELQCLNPKTQTELFLGDISWCKSH